MRTYFFDTEFTGLRKDTTLISTETGTEETSERCGNQKTDTQALPDWRCGGIGAGFYD